MNKLRPRRFTAVLAVPLVLSFVLAGCSSTPSSTASSATSAPVAGGTLVVGIATDGKCIDPQQVGNNDQIAIARQTVASLTIQDPATGNILPWVASSWDISSDASQYTFHLKTDAVFADGTPIDAAAVKANFDSIVQLGAKASLASSYIAGLSAVTVVDPQTVTIAFSKPNIQFLQASSTFSLGLLSTASTALGADVRCTGKFVGSGPYEVDSFVADNETVLSKVAGYNLGTAANSHTGEAYLDKIDYKVIPEAGVRSGSLQSGQIDTATGITQTDITTYSQNPSFQVVTRYNPGVPLSFYPNLTRPILQDQSVRQAIAWAIDRREVTTAVYNADATEVSGALSSTTPLFTAPTGSIGFDTAKAKKLLDDDGWTVGSDGIREKNGQKLSLTVVFYTPSDPVVVVQQELKAVGIDLQLQQVQLSDLSTITKAGNFDFQYYGLTRADPDVLRTIFGFSNTNVNKRAAAEPIDDLLAQQASEPDVAKRTALITEIQKDLLDEGYSIPIYQFSSTVVSDSKAQGVKFEASSRLDFYDAWISK